MSNKKTPFDLNLVEIPASREPVSLLAVDRATSELRRGRVVAIRGNNGAAVVAQAVEGLGAESFAQLAALSGGTPALTITARRACVLGLPEPSGKTVTLITEPVLDVATALAIADPTAGPPAGPPTGLPAGDLANFDLGVSGASGALKVSSRDARTHDSESAAITLTKLARLLPSAVTAPVRTPDARDLAHWTRRHDIILIDAGDIFQYARTAARSLRIVSQARVPLADAEDVRIVAFRPEDGGIEHLAIIIGAPEPTGPVLTRIHSECFTGDLLGSLRCDCGDQLRGAIAEISAAGAGVLLYLAQEGRGIGLVNKLRAYTLQDDGFDTIDANEQLGFDADERVFLPAARMLQVLDFGRVELMTNNPLKVSGLEACGVTVSRRVAHAFPANKHNAGYLQTKAARGGHLF